MSLLGAISNSLSSLNALQADMQVVSGNVANAQNPAYTRKTINLSADTISGGVFVSGYTRATDTGLSTLLQQANGDNGLLTTQQNYLKQIQDMLGSSQSSPALANDMAAFQAAWQTLSASPSDSTLQQDVIFKGQNLARDVNQLSSNLDQMTQDVQNDMSATVNTLNSTLTDIESLNQQIIAAKSHGDQNTENNLIDQRDADVQTLSSLVNIKVLQRSQDTIGIYTPGGLSLLDLNANQFAWDGTKITLTTSSSAGTDVTAGLTGGKIEAIAGMLDQGSSATTLNDPGKASIYKVQQQLQTLVNLFTSGSGTFATAYDSATTGAGELASGFFTGATLSSFSVNANLLDGTNTLKQAAASGVAADMSLANRTITTSGLSVTNASYTSYTNSIISKQNQNTQEITSQATVAKAQADDYKQRLQGSVGVNVDDEMATLLQLQNNYSATAHVLSTIQQMFQTLEQTV